MLDVLNDGGWMAGDTLRRWTGSNRPLVNELRMKGSDRLSIVCREVKPAGSWAGDEGREEDGEREWSTK